MLSMLHIENMAVFARAAIGFGDGLNILTGETGAGKSIVVDALGLVLGARSDRGLVRTGEPKAVVSALFSDLPNSVCRWMDENGMGLPSDGELLLLRELYADGKTVCRVNGRPQTVALLKELGQRLLNVHGQHDAHQLLRAESHRLLLDRFARHPLVLNEYTAAYDRWRQLCRERTALQMDEREKEERMEMLRYKLEDLERLAVSDNEEEALLSRRKTLRNTGKLNDVAELCRSLLAGDEDGDGACAMVDRALRTLSSAASAFDGWSNTLAKLERVQDELSDLTAEILDGLDGLAYSEDELEAIETRLDVLTRARERHGVPISELPARCKQYRAELDKLDYAELRLQELQRAVALAEEDLYRRAEALTESRRRAAEALRTEIERELRELDMAAVSFRADLVDGGGFGPEGVESVSFLLSANPGEPEKPLARIASGGELARIMLAMQNVLSQTDDVSTLVFDEVDVGVSGRAAQRVAEKLARVSRHKQVLCVTHLPQVAAFADTHLRIVKKESHGRADTEIQALDRDGRIQELGRLLGAESAGLSALENAKALLAEATSRKR